MITKVEALKKVAVALGYGSDVSEYTGTTIACVLREMAVKMGCAKSAVSIKAHGVADVLNYIAENYGDETNEPYRLSITATNGRVNVKRKGVSIGGGDDVLYDGDVLTITAIPNEGYKVTIFEVDHEAFESGSTFTVNGSAIPIKLECEVDDDET